MKRSQITFSVLGGLALLLPLLSYTIYQWAERNKDEALIQRIYDRQLNTILFSVNQYCWDKFETWTAVFTDISHQQEESRHRIRLLLKENRSLIGITLLDSSRHEILREGRFSRAFKTGQEIANTVSQMIASHQAELERLHRHAREGYVKPLSLELDDVDPTIDLILLPVVSLADSSAPWMIAGLFIDTHRFVQDVVIRKFNEMDDGNLAFATRSQEGDILFISDEETDPVFEKSEAMWILPDLQLLVKMKGTTLQSLSRQRTRNHLIFLLVINLLLGAGIIIFIQSVNKAIRLARMKSDFVANVSHELRTPLALIRMYAETLELGRITAKDKQKKYYRTIMNECSRLTQLVNNILDFSKIESRKKEYAFQFIQPEYWLSETLNIYRFHLDQKGFSLEADIQGEFPKIRADREAITQALTNLLDNAVKFSGDSRKIIVNLEKTDSSVILSVTDYGIGIASSEQKHIFDKFYRVGSSLIHDVKGTGLGLSLVKHIMQVHGGRVEVKSEPGQGSTFTLIFPIDDIGEES
jgi:two-component system phosphate regulon sensor histidine kinase PhoR